MNYNRSGIWLSTGKTKGSTVIVRALTGEMNATAEQARSQL